MQKSVKPEKALRKQVTKKIQSGDISGAVRILVPDDTIASFSPEVYEELEKEAPRTL